jgi:hypothetical protein
MPLFQVLEPETTPGSIPDDWCSLGFGLPIMNWLYLSIVSSCPFTWLDLPAAELNVLNDS